MERFRHSEKLVATVLRVEVIIFIWCSCGLPLTERNLKKWILSMKSSCIKEDKQNMAFISGFVLQKMHVPKRQPESSIMVV